MTDTKVAGRRRTGRPTDGPSGRQAATRAGGRAAARSGCLSAHTVQRSRPVEAAVLLSVGPSACLTFSQGMSEGVIGQLMNPDNRRSARQAGSRCLIGDWIES